MLEVHIPCVTFHEGTSGNFVQGSKPQSYFVDRSGEFAIRIFAPNAIDHVYIRVAYTGVWRRVQFTGNWTPPQTNNAYGPADRTPWVSDSELKLRVGDIDEDGWIEPADAEGTDFKYITDRLNARTSPLQPVNDEKSIYFYDWYADINRDGKVNITDRTIFVDNLSILNTNERGDLIIP
jgi:hypothetical protein